MMLLLPILFLLITAITLFIIRQVRSEFRHFWLIAVLGGLAAFASIFLWRFQIPIKFAPLAFESDLPIVYAPVWLVDSLSWPYAVSLITLALAVIVTSVVQDTRDPLAWSGTLIISAFGILAVTTDNIYTLLLAWAALDIIELIISLISISGEKSESVFITFASRMAGIGLVMWATIGTQSSLMDVHQIPREVGFFLVLAVGVRMGVLPLHLPYHEIGMRRGFGTIFRLVSAASSLSLLGHLPDNLMENNATTILILLIAVASLYAGWMWLRSPDELAGRPFWLLGLGSLSIGAVVSGNPLGSISWGIGLILGGGLIFLYSARMKNLLWLQGMALIGLSALPFTVTAGGWNSQQPFFWYANIPGQALLMAGIIKHSVHPGDSAFESLQGWAKAFYTLGLGSIVLVFLLLGIWGWDGSANVGRWWVSLPSILIAVGIAWVVVKRGSKSLILSPALYNWANPIRLNWLYRWFRFLYRYLGRIVQIVSEQLEGDSGILWSLVILVLLLSLMIQAG